MEKGVNGLSNLHKIFNRWLGAVYVRRLKTKLGIPSKYFKSFLITLTFLVNDFLENK